MSLIGYDNFGSAFGSTLGDDLAAKQVAEAKLGVRSSEIEGVGLPLSEAVLAKYGLSGARGLYTLAQQGYSNLGAAKQAISNAADEIGNQFSAAKQAASDAVNDIGDRFRALRAGAGEREAAGDEEFGGESLQQGGRSVYSNFTRRPPRPADEDIELDNLGGDLSAGKLRQPYVERPDEALPDLAATAERAPSGEVAEAVFAQPLGAAGKVAEGVGAAAAETEGAAAGALETAGAALDATGIGAIAGALVGLAGLGTTLGELFGVHHGGESILPRIVAAPQLRTF